MQLKVCQECGCHFEAAQAKQFLCSRSCNQKRRWRLKRLAEEKEHKAKLYQADQEARTAGLPVLEGIGIDQTQNSLKEVDGSLTEERWSPPTLSPPQENILVTTNGNSSKWLDLFMEFITALQVDTKDYGRISLRDSLFESQLIFLKEVCKGLDEGIHEFWILKARQLGITTISLALDLFWLIVHPGMQYGLVTDTDDNKQKAIIILKRYLESLPKSYRPEQTLHNRTNLQLANGSVLDYLVAGTKRGGKGLGKSRAFAGCHGTEVSAWGDGRGFDSLRATLAEKHPWRIRIWESTAEGFNMFYDGWQQARDDPHAQRCIFIGWWAKRDYTLDNEPRLMEKYGADEPNEEEAGKIKIVKELYGYEVTRGQLAWYRHKQSTGTVEEGTIEQNYPWHEYEAFVLTGSHFFSSTKVSDRIKVIADSGSKFEAYKFFLGQDVLGVSLEKAYVKSEVELRIWQRPSPQGKYVIGCDSAYGNNEHKDRNVVSVWRCYADKLVQVAEYASPDSSASQCAWVLAFLGGLYKDSLVNLEVNGVGWQVIQELKHLKQLSNLGVLTPTAAETGDTTGDLRNPELFTGNFLSGLRSFIWRRPDGVYGAGGFYHTQSTDQTILTMMGHMRDKFYTGELMVNSVPMLEEMHKIIQNGSSIGAEGRHKDDRVFAGGFAVQAWVDSIRPGMLQRGETYERVLQLEADLNDPIKRDARNQMWTRLVTTTLNANDEEKKMAELSRMWR